MGDLPGDFLLEGDSALVTGLLNSVYKLDLLKGEALLSTKDCFKGEDL